MTKQRRSFPECGYTDHEGNSCTASGEHFCVPRADRAQAFIETVLVHTKSLWARQRFVLADWERDDIVRPLFGLVEWTDEWGGRYRRRYTVGWIELGRGNGKSELAAAIVLLLMVGDDEESAEVYGAAKNTRQAGKVGQVVKRMYELSRPLRERLTYNKQARRLIDEQTNSYYEVIPADAEGELGHNLYGGVIDEVLAQASPALWEALHTAQGKRPWSLLLGFTTAGDDQNAFAAHKHREMMEILEDPDRARHVFVYIRGIPKDQEELDRIRRVYAGHPDLPVSTDVFDERNWRWPNPALDDFLSRQTLREEASEARHDPAAENAFRQYRANQWTSSASRFMPLTWWDACTGEVAPRPDWVESKLEGVECFGGLDLSARIDLTSVCWYFPDSGWLLWRFWLPEAAIDDLDVRNSGRIWPWVDAGWITATEGEVIDYEQVYDQLAADVDRFRPVDVTYDPWMGDPVVQAVQQRTRLDMWPLPQRYEYVTDALTKLRAWCKESIARVEEDEPPLLRHGGNPVARWCADALEVTKKRDNPDLIRPAKPDRDTEGRRIDGMTATMLAIDGAVRRHQHQQVEPRVTVIS